MDWSIIISVFALWVSAGSFVFSIYKYRKSEKNRIESQSRAIIRGSIIKTSQKSGRELNIYNAGNGTAHNIKVVLLDDAHELLGFEEKFIEMLASYDSHKYRFSLGYGQYRPDTIKLRYRWDDEYQKNNENVQVLQIR